MLDQGSCPGLFSAQYFNNVDLAGAPVLTRCEAQISNYWCWDTPAPGTVGADNFSVRWTGQFSFPGGTWAFVAYVDDGVRVYVNNDLVINSWRDQGPTEYTASRSLGAGTYEIRVEYYERGGWALARVKWCQQGQYLAEYFNNVTLTGPPLVSVCEAGPAVNHAWCLDSPAPGLIGADNFSARWVGRHNFDFNFDGPGHAFNAVTDDGIRVWVDGSIVIDRWHDQGPTEYESASLPLTGEHEVKAEYYEHLGWAIAQVYWGPTCIVSDLATCGSDAR